jgi:hypothetical protein
MTVADEMQTLQSVSADGHPSPRTEIFPFDWFEFDKLDHHTKYVIAGNFRDRLGTTAKNEKFRLPIEVEVTNPPFDA